MLERGIKFALSLLVFSLLTACGPKDNLVCNTAGMCFQSNTTAVNSLAYSSVCRINDFGQCYTITAQGYCANANNAGMCIFYRY